MAVRARGIPGELVYHGAELVYHGAELVYHGAELVYPPPPMPPSKKNIKVSPAPPRLEREPRPHARLPPGPRTLMFFLIGGMGGGGTPAQLHGIPAQPHGLSDPPAITRP